MFILTNFTKAISSALLCFIPNNSDPRSLREKYAIKNYDEIFPSDLENWQINAANYLHAANIIPVTRQHLRIKQDLFLYD